MKNEWRYKAQGKVKHYLDTTDSPTAICGATVYFNELWYGTGSQEEYEKLDSLPQCKNCEAKLR